MRPPGLTQRVRWLTTLGMALVVAMSVVLMSIVLWTEQEELFDQQLAATAGLLAPLWAEPGAALPDAEEGDPREALVFRLRGPAGEVVRQAGPWRTADLPDAAPPGYVTSRTHRIYTAARDGAGRVFQVAAPLSERREAFREEIFGFLLPLILFLPLTWVLTGWIARRALSPLSALRREISTRDGSRLDPIDASDWPAELTRIAGTLNSFMARLVRALESERAFASNAAHELRTPVAIALAQVQHLRETAGGPADPARLMALERALQRMRRLVERLLQLARAEAGIGLSSEAQDIAALAAMIVADLMPRAAPGRITLETPGRPVPALIDPDAFAIVLGNLVENALQHGDPERPVAVRVVAGARVEVESGGEAVAGLADLSARFARGAGRRGKEGFGLGLHICTRIAEQSGGRLDLVSPVPGGVSGVLARLTLRPAPEPAGAPRARDADTQK